MTWWERRLRYRRLRLQRPNPKRTSELDAAGGMSLVCPTKKKQLVFSSTVPRYPWRLAESIRRTFAALSRSIASPCRP